MIVPGYLPQIRDNSPNIWPKQPYQPEYVAINYKVTKRNSFVSVTCESISLISVGDMIEYYYKCINGVNIKKGLYHDAFKDCEKSNSSIETYLNEVSKKRITGFRNCEGICRHITYMILVTVFRAIYRI